ncbi:MAG TPA: RNA polymerase sigma factor [Patescibacteria group bacterium]|nr:RNA polymerase sigma factor [Patescibacteria group bacterium]
MDKNESQLIKKCQNGSLESFGPLYDKYIKKIYNYLYYRVPDKAVAEDVCSQTFIKALKAINSYSENKGTFSAWLYRIAKNNLIDYYRAYKNDLNVDDLWYLEDDTDIESTADKKVKLDKIKNCLNHLKKEQKEIIILRVWDELTYSEIAEIVDKSETSCKMIFSRSLEKIKQELPLSLYLLLLLNF